jgi:MtN3 and saliva related transmembrane protein
MFAILALGIGAWVVYGLLKDDFIIIISNAISLTLLGVILFYKFREDKAEPASAAEQRDTPVKAAARRSAGSR